MKQKVFIFLSIIFVAHVLFRIYEYRSEYLTRYDHAYWKQKYENSQWSTKSGCENLDPHVNPYTCTWDDEWYNEHKNDPAANDLKKSAIGDDGVYTYAGWEYIHGQDPSTLNAELPPFGKYLIGLSEIVFQNQNIFALLSGIFVLISFYLVNLQFFKSKLFAALPVFLFSFEPLFYTQLRSPMLDNLYLGLLLMLFYFLLKKKFILSSIFLGLMAATKSSASTFPLVIAVEIIYLFMTKQMKDIKKYLISLPIAGITFLLVYIQYFLLGHTFKDFLGVQKWILHFYANGAKGSLTAPWEMLFTGQYKNWWGEQSFVSEWHIGWILLFVGFCVSIYLIIKHFRKHKIIVLAIWTVVYLLFLSFVPVWSRYFLLIIPFMYTLSIWSILYFFNKHEIK